MTENGTSNIIRRVKLYQLDSENNWLDRGTGNVDYYRIEAEEEDILENDTNSNTNTNNHHVHFQLIARDEEHQEIMLSHRVDYLMEYETQGETIIIFADLALSFQDSDACEEVYNAIIQYIKEMRNRKPTLDNLEEILLSCKTLTLPYQATEYMSDNYIMQLLSLLKDIEEKNLITQAYYICQIIRTIICYNNEALIEKLMSDKYYLLIFHALEYDFDENLILNLKEEEDQHANSNPNKAAKIQLSSYNKHRTFLKNANLKLLKYIDDDIIKNYIKINFRLIYLRNVVLLDYLNNLIDNTGDSIMNTLLTIITNNNRAIITSLNNDVFIKNLFIKIQQYIRIVPQFSKETTIDKQNQIKNYIQRNNLSKQEQYIQSQIENEIFYVTYGTSELLTEKKNLIMFIQELINIAKTLQHDIVSFYTRLNTHGIYNLIETLLICSHYHEEYWLYLSCIDILSSLAYCNGSDISNEPIEFRLFLNQCVIQSKYQDFNLLGLICNCISSANCPDGLRLQLIQLIKASLIKEDFGPSFDESDDSTFFDRIVFNGDNNQSVGGTTTNHVDSPHVIKNNTDIHQNHQFHHANLNDSESSSTKNVSYLNCLFQYHFTNFSQILLLNDIKYQRVKFYICDLYTFAIIYHSDLIQSMLLKHQILRQLIHVLDDKVTANNSQLLCAILRLFRKAITLPILHSQIITFNLFQAIMNLFEKNGARYNLINSLIIELLTYIKDANYVTLIQHIVQHYYPRFSHLTYTNIFQQLKDSSKEYTTGLTTTLDALNVVKQHEADKEQQEDQTEDQKEEQKHTKLIPNSEEEEEEEEGNNQVEKNIKRKRKLSNTITQQRVHKKHKK